MSATGQSPVTRSAPVLRVRTPDGHVHRFTESFHIGRGEECEVRIDDALVSRRHLLVSVEDGRWTFQDLRSANGVFADGMRLETAAISKGLTISLGRQGPIVSLEIEQPGRATDPRKTERESQAPDALALNDYAARYLTPAVDDEPVGRRTMMIRKAFQQVQKKQKRKYLGVVVVLAAAVVAAAGYAYYGHLQMAKQKALAEDLFYSMKTLDVDIANLERLIASSGGAQGEDQVKRYLERRRQMENTYDSFVANLYNRDLTESERLILRVTRIFGECEIAAPPEYLDEVARYIAKWQSSGRFARAITLAQEKGYPKFIAKEFLKQDLPPQFIYLAMQESDFNAFASGPPTYMGFAKGMWQFVPDTARRYGLQTGPLVGVPQPDAADDRHKWDKATVAAARYIKDIYSTDAQASGLLVMAGYNWGEQRVINMVRSLSPNPKDRNFWKLLERYRTRIPKQTYDYVFYIVSAAVIGENPKAFGFPFDSPLKFLETDEGSK